MWVASSVFQVDDSQPFGDRAALGKKHEKTIYGPRGKNTADMVTGEGAVALILNFEECSTQHYNCINNLGLNPFAASLKCTQCQCYGLTEVLADSARLVNSVILALRRYDERRSRSHSRSRALHCRGLGSRLPVCSIKNWITSAVERGKYFERCDGSNV